MAGLVVGAVTTISKHKKFVLLLGVGIVLALTVWLLRGDVKPVGRLSRRDVVEIRSVVASGVNALAWRSIFQVPVTFWPHIIRQKLTFRIVEITEDSIGSFTIHPDGTREEPTHSVWVRVRSAAYPKGYYFRVIRVGAKGKWVLPEPSPPPPKLILFHFSNPSPPVDGGSPFPRQIQQHQPAATEAKC